MKLTNEFAVSAPLDLTWATLLDIERVGSCLPGAVMHPVEPDGTFRGEMKIKLGPIGVAYEGTARLVEVDEDAHRSVMQVQGREQRGQGTASATITNTLIEDAGRTRVRVETELDVTGKQAQFGRGIMEDVAGRLLKQFAGRLEELVAAGPVPPTHLAQHSEAESDVADRATAPLPPTVEAARGGRSLLGRARGPALALGPAIVVALLAARLRGPRRRSIRVEIRL